MREKLFDMVAICLRTERSELPTLLAMHGQKLKPVNLTSNANDLRSNSPSCLQTLSILLQHLPFHVFHPPKIRQPLPPLPFLLEFRITLPLQTPPRNITINFDILDQRLHTHIIILRPDVAQHEEIQRRAVEVVREVVQDVDLDGAHGVLIERVVADRQHGGVDLNLR